LISIGDCRDQSDTSEDHACTYNVHRWIPSMRENYFSISCFHLQSQPHWVAAGDRKA
jgi:hypothetical protein